MSGVNFTSDSIPVSDNLLNGGLNSTSGPLNVQNNESSDLQNIDFNKFGSILKRNGYTTLETDTTAITAQVDGLHWYEYVSSGAIVRKAVEVAGTKLYKMDSLDGTWDDITGTLSITATNHFDFENFLNKVYMTNNTDVPSMYDGTTATDISQGLVLLTLTKAKFVTQFNNYLFLANVTVGGTGHQSRFYWSGIKDADSWTATDFIEVSKDDGQDITGMKVLGDRLVIFKRRSIYNVFFTGDPDIPFILPGGGKSNSAVGCVAPFSIQEVENGLVFLSSDGFYFYDGNNSTKISDKITTTLLGYNTGKFENARSLVQLDKNRYWCALTSSGQTENDRVLVWDWFNNAWSVYVGLKPSSMATFYVTGLSERPYFGDYAGINYRADNGTDDEQLNDTTAITAYYYTNWKHYDDLVDKKNIPRMRIYHQTTNAVLTFAYSYDFESTDQYTNTFSLATSSDVFGSAMFGSSTFAGSGGQHTRRDLAGSGNVVRFKFANDVKGETFQVDGFGSFVNLETSV